MSDSGPLQIRLTHGVAGRPLVTSRSLAEAALFGTFPYHGIPSRGVDGRANELEVTTRTAWYQVAAPLEDLLCKRLREDDVRTAGSPLAASLLAWYRLASECGMRSLRASATAACEAAQRITRERSLDVRWLKEGKTSSVWLVEATGSTGEKICINVGRDRVADEELLTTTEQLVTWGERDRDHVCRVFWWGRLPITTEAGPGDVAVTIAEWIDGVEIHAPSHDDRLAAVDHFSIVEAVDGNPPRQQAIGWWLSPEETRRVVDQYRDFMTLHSVAADPATFRVPRLEINDGDLVWTGERIVVVAASPSEVWSRERWLAELARLRADHTTAVFEPAAGGG